MFLCLLKLVKRVFVFYLFLLLLFVFLSFLQEALEIDKAMVNVSAGRRLVREKEHTLKKLEGSMHEEVW